MKVQIKCAESLKVKQISAGRHNADREKGKFVFSEADFYFSSIKPVEGKTLRIMSKEAHVHKKVFLLCYI